MSIGTPAGYFKEMHVPKLFSFDFHVRYFPALLWTHLRLQERQGIGFSSTLEYHISLAVCIVLLAFGIPSAASSGSLVGWFAGGIGAAGTIALVIHGILSHKGVPVSYDDFLAGVFFFFVFLGISCGIFIGTLKHSFLLGLMTGLAGFAGYLIGILASLYLQHLGWVAVTVNGLAGIATLVMFAVDLVLLTAALF